MANRSVFITGVGPVSGLGLGLSDTWPRLMAGESALAPVQAFDARAMGATLGSEIPDDFKIRNFVPKTHRKATKVMARDIELAVSAADLAARDAKLITCGTDATAEPSYPSDRIGCHIGAGLIAADLDELTSALAGSVDNQGHFDLHHWGREGMQGLTPLWLLKYLPNMLACHVTIVHGAHGPSNTITCGEASGGLSIGESLRIIQRGAADLCFCGGAASNVNPMAFLRQVMTGRMYAGSDASAVRPFDQSACGGVTGEGGGIVALEEAASFKARGGSDAYAKISGFGASQTVHRETLNRTPDPAGRGIVSACRAALREANLNADAIDLVIPFGLGHPDWDNPEAAALHTLLGDRLNNVPVLATKALVGNLGAGSGGFDLTIAAQILKTQQMPAIANRPTPLNGLGATTPDRLNTVLVCATGTGGQNTAMVLEKL
ncbi:MAG: beta-ketoacyl synthase N-terminal-like domain-containing protein [Algisphaera sp.]